MQPHPARPRPSSSYYAAGGRPPRADLTTGQVANICQVAPRTVSKWFDSGRLCGYVLPGSRDRRVTRDSLRRFLSENGMPLGELAGDGVALLVGPSADLAGRMADLLGPACRLAKTGFEAGTVIASLRPAACVLDHALGRGECLLIAAALRRRDGPGVVLIGLLDEDEPCGPPLTGDLCVYDDCFRKPFDPSLLATRLAFLTGGKLMDTPNPDLFAELWSLACDCAATRKPLCNGLGARARDIINRWSEPEPEPPSPAVVLSPRLVPETPEALPEKPAGYAAEPWRAGV